MPKLVKTKGGYKVVDKYTGKTIKTFRGVGARTKAQARVRKGY